MDIRIGANFLNDLGFSYLWMSDNLSFGQIQVDIKRLNDQNIQKWFSDLGTMPKLCTYNMFKTDPTFENTWSVLLIQINEPSLQGIGVHLKI